MLLFSTVLQISKRMTKEAFIKLVIEWNAGSPHKDNVIKGINWHGEKNIRYGNDDLWLDIEEYRNQNIIAVRYEKKDSDGIIWDTDYVMNFNDMKMSIRLDRSYTQNALSSDQKFSTPHFITLLINNGYLTDDVDLPVTRTPLLLDEKTIDTLAYVINGETNYRLPVVYVSRTYDDKDPVDIWMLTSKLKGVAHVFVEKSKDQNTAIRERCNDKNEYCGAIGIYYPNKSIVHRRYLYHQEVGYDEIQLEKVARAVMQFNNTQMIDMLLTWQGVNNAMLMDRLTAQRQERQAAEKARMAAEEEATRLMDSLDEKEKNIRKQALEDANNEANKILDGFESDMQRLQKQIGELNHSNEVLQYENQGLRAKLDETDEIPVLFMGVENEFYQGEIKDLLLAVLADAVKNVPSKSRREDVVKDIISNNEYQELSNKRAEEIKRLLKNYTGMTSKLRAELERYGFQITEDGKHCKLTYYGDDRYQIILAKTPSDVRSGKNDASTLIRNVF